MEPAIREGASTLPCSLQVKNSATSPNSNSAICSFTVILSFACKLRDELPATIPFLPEADPVCQLFDRDGDFNYDIKFKEATRESPLLTEKAEKLKKDGYAINHARVRLGSGREVFVEGKKLLESWGYSFASVLL